MKNENIIEEEIMLAPKETQKNAKENVNDTICLTNTDEQFIMKEKSPEFASISLATSSGGTCCCCPNISIETAIEIPIGSTRHGCLCCPEAALWYKITPNHAAGESPLYTIHSIEPTDVRGYLFNSNGVQIASNDEHIEGRGFFKMARRLTRGETYYLMVTGNGTNTGYFSVRVAKEIWPESVTLSHHTSYLHRGSILQLTATVFPKNATVPASGHKVIYLSDDTSIATVDPVTGLVTAINEGSTTIRVYDWNQRTLGAQCTVNVIPWGKGKTPVFLIHGRTSHSSEVWGAVNGIGADFFEEDDFENNHFNSSIDAMSLGYKYYWVKSSQDISDCRINGSVKVDGVINNNFTLPGIHNGKIKEGKYTSTHPEGGNLAYYLKNNEGYTENINLFVFNYPNEDAVVHNAKKFEAYIENLISYVRNSGSNEMKYCFYSSIEDYHNNNYKFNIVAHSMGGLVSRYYIENLGHDNRVDKLITICTPHWGTGWADAGAVVGEIFNAHKLCDHDLRLDSKMYGGDNFTTELNCNAITGHCYDGSYTLSDELNYTKSRSTKYYAISGIAFNVNSQDQNDYPFELSTSLTTYQQIQDYIASQEVYISLFGAEIPLNTKILGDNLVGFLSQIGWTEDGITSPDKKVQMERIFVDIDTNAGNLPLIDILHNKIPHRTCVIEKVCEYLNL